LREFSATYLGRLLSETGGNITAAARRAGSTRSALQKLLKRFAINAAQFKN